MSRRVIFWLLLMLSESVVLVHAQSGPEPRREIAHVMSSAELPGARITASSSYAEGYDPSSEASIPSLITTTYVVADVPYEFTALTPVQQITQQEILSSAGTYGDFVRYLQLLPGVIWSSDLNNDVLVRGGHPTENLFVVDGFEVPNINHFSLSGSNGGFTSMIDSTAVENISMRDDVYDAGYASRLSSMVDIHTRELGDAHQAGNLTVGIAGAGGLYQRALAHNGNFLLSAHRSIMNLVTNDIGINGVPTYTNGMARLELRPSEQDSILLFSLNGADSINITPCQVTEAASIYQTQYSGWRTSDALSWRHNFSSHTTADLIANTSFITQNIGQQQQYGQVNDCNKSRSEYVLDTYKEDSHNNVSMLNYELRISVRGWLLSTGVRGMLSTPDYSVAQPNGTQTPFSADHNRSDAVTFHRNFSTGQAAGFLGAEGDLGKRWKLMAGLRVESFAITGSYALDPRISIAYKLNSRQSIHGSVNIASQLPPLIDMVSYASNRNLRPTQVFQETLGMRLLQANWGTLDVEAYQKNYRHEAVSTEYPSLMLSNMIDTLGQEFVWLPLTSAGTEQSRGLEMSLHAHWGNRIRWMISASRSQTTYRALDGIRRLDNFDVPMIANAMGNIWLPKKIQLDLRETISSGRTYTPFDIIDSTAQNRGIYDMSRVNAERGLLYNRLDLELERLFHTSKGNFELHMGLENVMNRGNLMGYVWLDNCTQFPCPFGNSSGQPIAKVDQMGRYPVFNLRYEF
jgi:hypothetical protein